MVKILIGLVATVVVAAGGYFGFDFYVQHRVSAEVEAAFEQLRSGGGKASHGSIAFDPFRRTFTIADVALESAAQPPLSVRIAGFTAAGVSQGNPGRFSATSIDLTDVEVTSSMPPMQTGQRGTYHAPRITIAGFSGPVGPMRRLDDASPTDIYRLVVEQFSAVTAASISAPSLTANVTTTAGGPASGSGEYTYTNLAMRDIKDGKIATSTIERTSVAAHIDVAGKTEIMIGELDEAVFYDFDAAATAAILDPARAKDDSYYRMYRQGKTGVYTVSLQNGPKFRFENLTFDDIGVRPSRLQLPMLAALAGSIPPPGTQPTAAQSRAMMEKIAGIYQGVRIANAEMRGLSIETPEGTFKLAAIRFNIENGKLGEFAFEGLDMRSPQGPVKIGRFALKSLDLSNLLLRASSTQFVALTSAAAATQLFELLPLLQGAELKGFVAPYKDSTAPVSVESLNIDWGQFVGPIPSQVRFSLKMSSPIVADDPTFKALIPPGFDTAALRVDLGTAWTESPRTFVVEPLVIELGGVLSASARISLGNVPREAFSTNPLQAAFVAAQIEAGTIELTLHDIGGVDLALAQYARTQNLSPEAARHAITDNIKANGTAMAAVNPDAEVIAEALTRFIENPRGSLTIKLTPRSKVQALQLYVALKADPLGALGQFRVEASNGP